MTSEVDFLQVLLLFTFRPSEKLHKVYLSLTLHLQNTEIFNIHSVWQDESVIDVMREGSPLLSVMAFWGLSRYFSYFGLYVNLYQ